MTDPGSRARSVATAAAILCVSATGSWADLTGYSQSFEGLSQADPDALGNDGWLVFGNVFDGTTEEFLYDYGPFAAPNGGEGFCAIATGQGGPDQGAQQLSVYNDYANTPAHTAGDLVEANVYQEQTIGVGDVGATYVFAFDAKLGNIEGSSTAVAFIKILDPDDGFSLTGFLPLDMTSIPVEWTNYSISVTIGADWDGQLLQFGFLSTATDFEGSGIFYDNVAFGEDTTAPEGYFQDFEALNPGDAAALADDGWLVFGNVFDGTSGEFLYDYGPFPAPNGGEAFSAIATGQGGPDQGAQQLSVYNDYANTPAHTAGDVVEANVYQERTIVAGDVDKVFTLAFDAKLGNLEGSSTAAAFIKVLDPDDGFSLTAFPFVDMTSIPVDWSNYSVSIVVPAEWVGQLIQFGFLNTATDFEGSGIFYDNVSFAEDDVLDVVDSSTTPPAFALAPAAPNPFTPRTTLSFELYESTRVALQVFDASGRLVRTLVDGRRGAGLHQESWDGRDGTGQRVASGVYFTRMTADGTIATRPVVLVR